MDKATLVDADKEAGRALIEALETERFPIHAAFWLYVPESQEWRLYLASPIRDEGGPREAYSRVQAVLKRFGDGFPISLDNISVVSPAKDKTVRALATVIPPGEDPAGLGLYRGAADNIYIDGAYIYRVA